MSAKGQIQCRSCRLHCCHHNNQPRQCWKRRPDEQFIDGRYSRAHEWQFDGGAQVHASASPHVVRAPFSDPSAVDPEEAFVAAIASCHMLFFLAFAAKRGFQITTYEDRAVGVMSKTSDGRASG